MIRPGQTSCHRVQTPDSKGGLQAYEVSVLLYRTSRADLEHMWTMTVSSLVEADSAVLKDARSRGGIQFFPFEIELGTKGKAGEEIGVRDLPVLDLILRERATAGQRGRTGFAVTYTYVTDTGTMDTPPTAVSDGDSPELCVG